MLSSKVSQTSRQYPEHRALACTTRRRKKKSAAKPVNRLELPFNPSHTSCENFLLSSGTSVNSVLAEVYVIYIIYFTCSGSTQCGFRRRPFLEFQILRQRFTMQYLQAGIILVLAVSAILCQSAATLLAKNDTACRWV